MYNKQKIKSDFDFDFNSLYKWVILMMISNHF